MPRLRRSGWSDARTGATIAEIDVTTGVPVARIDVMTAAPVARIDVTIAAAPLAKGGRPSSLRCK